MGNSHGVRVGGHREKLVVALLEEYPAINSSALHISAVNTMQLNSQWHNNSQNNQIKFAHRHEHQCPWMIAWPRHVHL